MKSIVVTGSAGFIGSNLARSLNKQGFTNLVLVDHFDSPLKQKNLEGIAYALKVNRDDFIEWLSENGHTVSFVFHLGARTDTTEFNFRVLDSLNLSYSKALWEVCTVKQLPLVYASSAATYGLGEFGFSDNHILLPKLKPLNPYGLSKHLFDLYAIGQQRTPPFWCGLKFFNVYGPFEMHKGRMASVVYHAYHQINTTGKIKLFQSHHAGYMDGEQKRDFVFVEDIVAMCLHFMQPKVNSNPAFCGIYNAGTGHAGSFNNLANALFTALNLPVNVEYIPTPADIRDKYQYYTQATTDKIIKSGFAIKTTKLSSGVKKYVDFLKNI